MKLLKYAFKFKKKHKIHCTIISGGRRINERRKDEGWK